MGSVTISGTAHDVYGEHTGAGSITVYAAASLAYDAIFTAAAADSGKRQKQAMVSAKNIFVRLPWSDASYADPTDPSLPTTIIEGSYELALAMLAGKVDINTGQLLAGNVKAVDDGVVSMQFFGAGGQSGQVSPLWMDVVAPYLAGGGTFIGGSTASNSDSSVGSDFDRTTATEDGDAYEITSA